MSEIAGFIDNEVKSNDVVLFMKGTPGFPQCGFSGQVVQILDYLGVDYKGVNILTSDELRQGIKDYSNWPTIPQLYVKGEFIGGSDIMMDVVRSLPFRTSAHRHARTGAPCANACSNVLLQAKRWLEPNLQSPAITCNALTGWSGTGWSRGHRTSGT